MKDGEKERVKEWGKDHRWRSLPPAGSWGLEDPRKPPGTNKFKYHSHKFKVFPSVGNDHPLWGLGRIYSSGLGAKWINKRCKVLIKTFRKPLWNGLQQDQEQKAQLLVQHDDARSYKLKSYCKKKRRFWEEYFPTRFIFDTYNPVTVFIPRIEINFKNTFWVSEKSQESSA